MKKSYRPGVYSQYDIISKPKSYEQRYAFFCGGAKVKEEKSIPANTVVQLRSVEELKEYFLEEGSGKVFCSIARMLLESGISGLYVVPITTDGSVPAAEDYAAAIQKLCEIKKNGVILCDSSEQSVLQVLKDKTQEASQNQRERVAVAAVPKSNAKSVAQSLNSERMVLCCQESGSSFAGEEKSVLFSAAAVAAMLAVSQPDDRFYSRKMEGLVSTEQLEESEIETLLQSGVTVLEEVESEVVCIRCVTTRTQNKIFVLTFPKRKSAQHYSQLPKSFPFPVPTILVPPESKDNHILFLPALLGKALPPLTVFCTPPSSLLRFSFFGWQRD